jgi:hypothetical protein
VTSDRPADYLASLVRELCTLPRETEWLEFKVDDAEPQAIGEYLSALANAAALAGRAFAGHLQARLEDGAAIVLNPLFAITCISQPHLPAICRAAVHAEHSWIGRPGSLSLPLASAGRDGHSMARRRLATP